LTPDYTNQADASKDDGMAVFSHPPTPTGLQPRRGLILVGLVPIDL